MLFAEEWDDFWSWKHNTSELLLGVLRKMPALRALWFHVPTWSTTYHPYEGWDIAAKLTDSEMQLPVVLFYSSTGGLAEISELWKCREPRQFASIDDMICAVGAIDKSTKPQLWYNAAVPQRSHADSVD
jgi:hypothetical protein